MVPRFGRSFVAYTWGEPFDRHDKTQKTGKSSDFSLKTDMLLRLLAPTQSGTTPDQGRMGQARLETSRPLFSSRTVTRRGREITCGSASDRLTPHWPNVSPNASIPCRGEDGRCPRVTARISLDSACVGLSIPSHCAAPGLPCRLVGLSLSLSLCRRNVANSV